MGKYDNSIEIDIRGMSVDRGALQPRLTFELSTLSTNSSFEILQSWIDSEVHFDKEHYSLPVTHVKIKRITRSRQSHSMFIEFPYHTLDQLETARDGRDIEFSFRTSLTVERQNNEEKDSYVTELSYSPERSEWADALDAFEYNNRRVVDIPLTADIEARDFLSTAISQVEKADRQHNSGNYQGSVISCRTSVETIQHLDKELLQEAVGEQRLERLNTLLGTFEKGILGLQSHSQNRTKAKPPLRRDSELALNITKAILRYYSTALEESDSNYLE